MGWAWAVGWAGQQSDQSPGSQKANVASSSLSQNTYPLFLLTITFILHLSFLQSTQLSQPSPRSNYDYNHNGRHPRSLHELLLLHRTPRFPSNSSILYNIISSLTILSLSLLDPGCLGAGIRSSLHHSRPRQEGRQDRAPYLCRRYRKGPDLGQGCETSPSTNPLPTSPTRWKPNSCSQTKALIVRAEGASANGFENLGLFAAAVASGNLAGLPAETLNLLTGGYIASRVVYNAIYLSHTTEFGANLRSATWLSGIGILMTIFVKSGTALQQRLV